MCFSKKEWNMEALLLVLIASKSFLKHKSKLAQVIVAEGLSSSLNTTMRPLYKTSLILVIDAEN